jgi:hypothetical protein
MSSTYDTTGTEEDVPVQADPDFPGSVLAMLADRAPLENGTQVHVEVDTGLGEGSSIHLCSGHHVHVQLGHVAPLTGINVVLIYGWSLARALDAVQWRQLPDEETVIASLETLCIELEPDLPSLCQHMRKHAKGVHSMLSGASFVEEDGPKHEHAATNGKRKDLH